MARFLPPFFQKGVDPDGVDSAQDIPYHIPNLRVEFSRDKPPGVDTGFWRGVGPTTTCSPSRVSSRSWRARWAGLDRLSPRPSRQNSPFTSGARPRREKSGWGSPLPARCGRGVAAQRSFASFIATVVECEVDDAGEVNLRRVTSAVDTGITVNPDTVMAQLQGGLIFGFTAGLYGEITFKKGRVEQTNFHDYRILRIDQIPPDRSASHRERRGARRYRRNRCDRFDPCAAQRNLCGDRCGAAAHARLTEIC